MHDKLNLPEEVVKRILKAETFKECGEIFKEALPGIWPKVHPNHLPDAVNRHMLAVIRRNAGERYDPPSDPSGMSRFPYKK